MLTKAHHLLRGFSNEIAGVMLTNSHHLLRGFSNKIVGVMLTRLTICSGYHLGGDWFSYDLSLGYGMCMLSNSQGQGVGISEGGEVTVKVKDLLAYVE
eukprot:1385865-Amorphochlora_amoeboformis.AAC.1